MAVIKDIGESALNSLQNAVTEFLLEIREFMIGEGMRYRKALTGLEGLKYTTTTLYINSNITSSLAVLYMIFGWKHGEISYEEMLKQVKYIEVDRLKVDEGSMHRDHVKLNEFRIKAEKLNTRINSIATGGLV